MDSFPNLANPSDGESHSDESFWPSFTDIMMVVVMIFLISTASLIIKNWGLTQELTNTIESEQVARQAAQITLAENMTLEERLAALENLLSVTQLSRMRTEEEKKNLRAELEQLTEDLTRSTDIAATLEAKLNTKTNEIREILKNLTGIESELDQAKLEVNSRSDELQQSRAELSKTQNNLNAAKGTITALETSQRLRQKEIASTKTQFDISEEQLARLRDEYTALESKYNKLVRPARTSKGKYVVSLRYQKFGSRKTIELKTDEAGDYKTVNESDMHKELGSLKQKLGDKLYIRIIFPEENKLSYQEAWKFTSDILNKYDYYQQTEEE